MLQKEWEGTFNREKNNKLWVSIQNISLCFKFSELKMIFIDNINKNDLLSILYVYPYENTFV